jgi:hypothetical protein
MFYKHRASHSSDSYVFLHNLGNIFCQHKKLTKDDSKGGKKFAMYKRYSHL